MIQVTVTKNLIALEDLLIGTGTAMQVRGVEGSDPVEVTEINGANLPYDADFSMQEKFDLLTGMINSLPIVVDGTGALLKGAIDTSSSDLSSTHSGRLWRKSINSGEARIYYGSVLVLKYNPTTGDLIVPSPTDYIAADVVVTNAMTALVTAEASTRASAVTAEASTRASADTAEASTRATADTAEASTRAAVDAALAAEIDNRANIVQQADIAASSNVTKTVTMVDGAWVKITVSSAFTLAFVFPSAEVRSMILEIVNGGAYVITWPAGTHCPSGTVPSLTSSGTDHVVVYRDAANTLYASVIAKDVKSI